MSNNKVTSTVLIKALQKIEEMHGKSNIEIELAFVAKNKLVNANCITAIRHNPKNNIIELIHAEDYETGEFILKELERAEQNIDVGDFVKQKEGER